MIERDSGAPEEDNDVRELVRALWKRRRSDVLARVGVLEAAVRSLDEGSLSEEDRRGAGSEAHKLAGTAGTFGFPHGSVLAREIEALLAGGESPVPIARLRVLVDELRIELEAHSET